MSSATFNLEKIIMEEMNLKYGTIYMFNLKLDNFMLAFVSHILKNISITNTIYIVMTPKSYLDDEESV